MGMIAERSADEWYSSLPKTSGIYHLINESMGDRSGKGRIQAVIALGESEDPRAVRPLMDCCTDRDPLIRLHATTGLSRLRSGRAVPVLVERLRDKNEQPETRKQAAAALAAIRSYSAIAGLRDLYADTDDDSALRSFVAEELHRIRIR